MLQGVLGHGAWVWLNLLFIPLVAAFIYFAFKRQN